MCSVDLFCTYMRHLNRHVLRSREGFMKPPQQCDARYILHMQVSLTAPIPAHFGVLFTASRVSTRCLHQERASECIRRSTK